MSSFRITISPPLPYQDVTPSDVLLDDLDYARILLSHTQEYDLTYHVDSFEFRYYPASIITVLNDIHEEWILARQRANHDMTLSGYTVLRIEFEQDNVVFSDPLPNDQVGYKSLNFIFNANVVEEEFLTVLKSIYSFARKVV